MLTASESLLSLNAGELMTKNLLTLPADMSLPTAARLLSRAQVSGAPVVDTYGRCIGVLSAADFVAWAQAPQTPLAPRFGRGCVCADWQIIDPEQLPDELVRNRMTADPVTVTPDASIGDLARMMVDAHIHRVIVVDADGRPVGIVSSTDVLAAVARAEHRGTEVALEDEEPDWNPPKKG
jgi:CBS domain-containing membrane protein